MNIVYKNIDLKLNFGVIVTKTNHLDLFERNLENIKIPGRSDNLIVWDGSYNNKNLEITCLLKAKNLENIKEILNEIDNLLVSNNYVKLQLHDEAELQNFILDVFFLKIKNIKKINNIAVEFVLEFTCRKEDDR